MKLLFNFFLIFNLGFTCAQTMSSEELLNKAIAYHDSQNNWSTFNDTFRVVMTTPNQSQRESTITVNLPAEYFKVTAKRDTVSTTYEIDKGNCQMAYNDKLLDELEANDKKMSCERGNFMKNYYTYLYGLPMKLTDPGTNLDDKVIAKTFKGKDYLVLRATYDETVGSDIWYFYFNPKTYAMEVYQFFRSDDSGKEKKDTGEYILLSEEALVNNVKMPKVRAWYYNKDDKYLGTDTLILK